MKRAVFCDFDGTITARETFVATLERFAPEVSARLLPEIYNRRLTLRDGVRQMLASIRSARYPDILDFVREQPLRPGFVEFLDFLDRHQVPLIVVSGGLQGMVEARLGKLAERVAGIHAAIADTTDEFLTVNCEFESEEELVAKVKVVERYGAEENIAIGDSITDLNLALAASVVFARDKLATYLEERGKAYLPWSDFFDVRDRLARQWEG